MSYCSFGYNLLGELARRVSGMPLADFVAARIFDPLGMENTFYVAPDSHADRIVTRPKDDLRSWFDSYQHRHIPWPAGCAFSTAMDLAIFGQTFLNEGSYGDVRLLGVPTVEAMTRNQIPGISARNEWRLFPEASWGLGWIVNCREKNDPAFGEALLSSRAFGHGGAGGVYLWVDPVYQLVAVYLNVHPTRTELDIREDYFGASLFINSVMGTIVEE
jgi:CubicO group peptidase (beta-lactamase class C family)